MGKKKSRKRSHRGEASSHKRRNFPRLLLITVCVGVPIAGGLLVFNKYTNEADQKTAISASDSSSESNAPTAAPDNLRKLVGRWVRPDGGYVIDIRKVDVDGTLQAAYFNPRPIHVSQARVTQKEGEIQIFIELRDVGYPGATYALRYNAKHDVLAGLYHQPAVGQTFDVAFVRMK
jgi:hypothetical protein